MAALVVGAILLVYSNTIWQFGQEKFFGTRPDYTIRRKEADAAIKQNDRNEAQKLLAEIQSARANAHNALAPKVAPQLWREAEQSRLAARTALTNGNFAEAKALALKAKQKYEEATGFTGASKGR